MSTEFGRIARNGLWDNNVVFGQLPALCPLLAVTVTATNGLGMGMATTAVMVGSGLAVSLLRKLIPSEIRIPAFVLLIATLTTIVDLAMNAWLHDLHRMLGLFIPLIVTTCAILGRAKAFASRRSPRARPARGHLLGLPAGRAHARRVAGAAAPADHAGSGRGIAAAPRHDQPRGHRAPDRDAARHAAGPDVFVRAVAP